MPLYEYRCVRCKAVTGYLRPAARRNEPATCPDCGAEAERIISKPQKWAPTEKSAQEILHDPEAWR